MRFYLILCMIAALLYVTPVLAQTPQPAFALSFRLDPPFNVTTPVPPTFYLEVCANVSCSPIIRSIPLNCSSQSVAPANAPVIVGCMVQVSMQPAYQDPNLALLSATANLRIRSNSLISPPFIFYGGKPTLPETFYNFTIMPGAGGFSVVPG